MPFGTIASAGAKQGSIGTSVTEILIVASGTKAQNLNYGGGFWFGGADNLVYKSNILSSWTTASYAGSANPNSKPQYWNGYYFLPTGDPDGAWRYSTDLSVTPTSGSVFEATARVSSMCYFGSTYYVFLNSAIKKYGYSSSISGTFTTVNNAAGYPSNGINWAATDGTTMVGVGDGGLLSTTTDGLTWTARTSSFGADDIDFVMYDTESSYWVASGANGKAAYSSNGTTWTQITSGLTAGIGVAINKCNGVFIIAQATLSVTTVKYSKSASSLPTSAFTAGSAITSTGISNENVYILATDGNYILLGAGKASISSR